MIELSQASVSYGGKRALGPASAVFADDSFICVVGPNGGGKSTLLRALAGLQPYEGSIRLDGRELRDYPRRERARRIAYLPQSRPVPEIDARTLIAHGRFPHLGFSKTLTGADQELVEEAAALTGAGDLLERSLPELSGGERQRVYLAMVVAQDARTVLLDEPATYLDVCHQLELLELLRRLHGEGRSVIMVAHDLPQAFTCAQEVKLVDHGALTAEGPPDALCGSPALAAAFGVSLRRDERPDSLYRYRLYHPGRL